MNVRPPVPAREEFLKAQDAYLQARLAERGVTDLRDLTPVQPGLYLWQGGHHDAAVRRHRQRGQQSDAGLLCALPRLHRQCDPHHAGVQLRLECAELMAAQGAEEPAGRAKITKAYNLPCRYVLHTVGPIIAGRVTPQDRALLAGCYRSCLELAAENGLHSLAFCCISTGEFRFPNELAAQIALQTVRAWQRQHPHQIEVIFNVFKDSDKEIYRRLLR